MSGSSISSVDSFDENNASLEQNQELDIELLEQFLKLKIDTQNETQTVELRENLEMAPPALDIKNLSIIPNFNGNPNKLYRFIEASEAILTHYFDTDNAANFQNVLLLNGILNKLEGRAEEVVAISGSSSNWNGIKDTLIQNFGDQRDENCLNQDLVNLRQKPNETPSQFHERVTHLLNTICNYVDLKCDVRQRNSKRDFFRKQALKTFLAGLREPLGSTIRAMRPDDLTQALQYITEEDNIRYYQRSQTFTTPTVPKKPDTHTFNNSPNVLNNQQFNRSPTGFNNQRNFQQPQFRPPPPYFSNQVMNQFPRGPINYQKYSNQQQQKFLTNSQVFGKPQNVWKPNPNVQKHIPKPTPMSGISSRPFQMHNTELFENSPSCSYPTQESDYQNFDNRCCQEEYSYLQETPSEEEYQNTPEEYNDEQINFHSGPNQTSPG